VLGVAPPRRNQVLTAIITAIDVLVGLGLIFLVLLHAGRGGGLSDMFGGGQLGGAMAGSTVVERNLDRITVVAAVLFTLTTIILGLRVGQ
jgi:preprotein translocase subunit SecG